MSQNHWEDVYQTKEADQVSWYQVQDDQFLDLLKLLKIKPDQKIIDVGSGASILIDQLIASEYSNLHVLDLSQTALEKTQLRLAHKGLKTENIEWVVGDICTVSLPHQHFDLWHDRAVFHFMTTAQQQEQYLANLKSALKKGGYLVMSIFAEDGPTQCSGLPVQRYSLEELQKRLGHDFILVHAQKDLHRTPWDSTQSFLNSVWQFQNQG